MKIDAALAIYKLPDDWKRRAPQYLAALSDVPPDLVDLALRQAVRTCKWLPQPSEIREPIARILDARHDRHRRMVARAAEHAEQLRERDEWLEARRHDGAAR